MIMVCIFVTIILNSFIHVQPLRNLLPDKQIRLWRCPGEECNSSNVCLGSICQCSQPFKCVCNITESTLTNIKTWEESTNKCIGYLDTNEECQHNILCFTRKCEKICRENKEETHRNTQGQNTGPNSSTKNTNANGNTNSFPRPSTNALNTQQRCKISADCRGPLACYEGLCVNWGSQCIGQGECDEGCCEGGYCQRDETVCNKYYSSLTILIISWIIIGFGLTNCFYWVFWYFIGRSKVIGLMSVGGGYMNEAKNVVQGMPVTTNNIIQQNNLAQNISAVNNVPITNVSKKVVMAKKENLNEGKYQNINFKSSHNEY
jgi:hypothetical protein